jgi:hypothetical protein
VALGDYRDLFTTIATAAATLTGLLFVAMSVAESHATSHPPVVREFRAAASLLAFINAFAVSLFALVPGTNIGIPAAVLGTTGVLFTAAGVRTTLAVTLEQQRRRPQVVLIAFLLATFGFELAYGIALMGNSHRTGAVTMIGYMLIASLLIGIARAWELVGDWDTGIFSSIALLVGHRSGIQRILDSQAASRDKSGPYEPGTDADTGR